MVEKAKTHGFNWEMKGEQRRSFVHGTVYAEGATKAIAMRIAKLRMPKGARITKYLGIAKKEGRIKRRHVKKAVKAVKKVRRWARRYSERQRRAQRERTEDIIPW